MSCEDHSNYWGTAYFYRWSPEKGSEELINTPTRQKLGLHGDPVLGVFSVNQLLQLDLFFHT